MFSTSSPFPSIMNSLRRPFLLLAVGCLLAVVGCTEERTTGPGVAEEPTPGSLYLEKIGGFAGGGIGAAEIVAYDPSTRRLFVVNGLLNTVDVLDLAVPSNPARVTTLNVSAFGLSANSVDVANGLVAVAVEANPKTNPGRVVFFRTDNFEVVSSVTVGALPDMVTFTPDGRKLLVANEGEPSADYLSDPEGSISIIDVSTPATPTVQTATFSAFNGQAASLKASGVRIYGPNATVAQDLEPEYIAVSDDGAKAWVTLQENNAIATVDIASASVQNVRGLGFKNHLLPQNALDASDKDGRVNSRNWPVFGMYQPDAVAAYTVGGESYLVTANEGDGRDWNPGLREEARVSTLNLNPAVFTDAVCGGTCKDSTRLGRLTVTRNLGLNPATNVYDSLFVLGARSFSIWSATTGQQIWDSADQFESRSLSYGMAAFNASHDNNTFDDRSDNKGPEPEGIAIGRIGRKTFAFIGLERFSGIMVYDITFPSAPRFVTYVSSREGTGGDRGPEGLTFVPARSSPTGQPLLIVGNEISGTTAVYRIDLLY